MKCSLWEYIGKAIFSHILEQVKIVLFREASSRESFYQVTVIGKNLSEREYLRSNEIQYLAINCPRLPYIPGVKDPSLEKTVFIFMAGRHI